MYIQKTKYYCPKCRTHDHWFNDSCPKANGETPLDQPVIPVAPKGVGVDRPERRPKAIVQAEEFLKKVGRPRVYPDRKTQMRELMRKRRAEGKA